MAGKFSIEAVFKAVDRMSAPIAKMHGKVESFIKSTEKGLGKVEKFNDRISSGLKAAGAAAAGAAFATAAVVRDVVTTGAEFDRTLVGAAAKFDPALRRGTAGFERLRLAAEEMGAKTEFNAQQGAEALKSLASAGFTADQAIASLPGVVDLATASEVDLGAAAEMATKSLGAFGLKVDDAAQLGKNLTRVTDVMAMAAGKTEASMEGLFESIKEGAPVAVSAGASMETFIAMAAGMASAGIEGSVAGTTLKNVFLSLSAPTKKASDQLRKLGITTREKNGDLRDVVDIFADLEKATSKMGTAKRAGTLESIFGRIPIAGVTKMLDLGAEKLGKLRGELEASGGATKKMAETMRDTVAGDIDGFTSAIDGVKIALFSANNGPIREVIQRMTEWIGKNKELIVQRVGDAVKWIGDNLPRIATWLERIAKGVVAFYAFSTAVKTVKLAIEGYEAAVAIAKATQWLFVKSLGATKVAAAEAAGAEGLAGMNKGLNGPSLVRQINGVNSLLGKAGLLGAALAVGVAFGSWLNHTFKLDEKLSDFLARLTGLEGKLNRHGRAAKPGLDPAGDQVLPDGSIRRTDGTWAYMSPARLAAENRRKNDFLAGRGRSPLLSETPAPNPLLARAPEPQVVSPYVRLAQSVTETTETTKAEVTIKDETGNARVTEKPKRGTFNLILRPSGAF